LLQSKYDTKPYFLIEGAKRVCLEILNNLTIKELKCPN